MSKGIWAVSGPLLLVMMMGGCMGRGHDEAQVGRAVMMPQAAIAGRATAAALTVAPGSIAESCAAGGWRPRLLDKRDAVLSRADLPAGHRVLHPGDMMSAEVDPQRMTVTVNSKGKIDGVYCG